MNPVVANGAVTGGWAIDSSNMDPSVRLGNLKAVNDYPPSSQAKTTSYDWPVTRVGHKGNGQSSSSAFGNSHIFGIHPIFHLDVIPGL